MPNADLSTQFLLGLYLGGGFAYAMKWWEIYEFHFTDAKKQRFDLVGSLTFTVLAQAVFWPGYVAVTVILIVIHRYSPEDSL